MSNYEEKFGSLSRVYGEDHDGCSATVACLRDRYRWRRFLVGRSAGAGPVSAKSPWSTAIIITRGKCQPPDSHSGINHRPVQGRSHEERAFWISIPSVKCNTIEQYLDDDNQRDIIERGYDAVIDAIDRIKYKAAIIYCCKRNKIPVVTTGGAGGLTDPTKIEVADLTRTWNDPLAASVRNRLRHKYGFTRNPKRTFGIPCVYSSEQQRYPDKRGQAGYAKPGVAGLSLDCSFGYGSVVSVTAGFGFAAAARRSS